MRLVQTTGARSISDTVVTLEPPTGQSTQDPEVWLDYFERYANFRKLSTAEGLELFVMMMQGDAADWLTTFLETGRRDYACLVKAFKNNYLKSEELKWKDAGAQWSQRKGPDERVEDYVTRVRKAAKRLQFLPEVLLYTVINGLRGPIKQHVVQAASRR
jgi:hypothetical protein